METVWRNPKPQEIHGNSLKSLFCENNCNAVIYYTFLWTTDAWPKN